MNQKLQASHHLFKKWTYFSYSQVLKPANIYHSKCRQFSSNVETYSESDLSKNCRSILTNLLAGERWALARAITLIESTNKAKQDEARKLVTLITRRNENINSSFRIGLSGPPGAGKSTFIERFGQFLTSKNFKVAVLAVDPSSGTTGGSLLGDKTRMTELSRNPRAFIRPSPNSGHLGGVTRTTNEAIVLCEAAGYNMILVETVGVGQSEYMVSDMVDCFCLLLAPGAGDELQGIKRGIVEQSDLIFVNKSDGDLIPAARRTATEYTSALKFMRPKSKIWKPKVMLLSARTGDGMEDAWLKLQEYRQVLTEHGELERRRGLQRKKWMWNYIQDQLLRMFNSHPGVRVKRSELEELVLSHSLGPGVAADLLISEFISKNK